MKKYKIFFWISTAVIFLSEGVLTAFTSHTPVALAGITSLGYPVYFATLLVVFKVIGAIALIVPQVSARIKEWAYAGFAIDFICAFVSLVAVNGFTGTAVAPLVFLTLLAVSYVSYHKIRKS